MKASINRIALLQSLITASTVIVKSNFNQLGEYVQLIFNGNELTVVATDLAVTYVDKVSVICNEPLSICVKASSLKVWLENRVQETIDIKPQGGQLVFRAKDAEIRLPTIDGYEYPEHTPLPFDSTIASINGNSLTSLINRTILVIDSKNTEHSPMFQSALMSLADDGISIIATDGVVLAFNRIRGDILRSGEHTIPIKALETIRSLVKGNELVTIKSKDLKIFFGIGTGYVYTTLAKPFDKGLIERIKDALALDHKNKALVNGIPVINALAGYRGVLGDSNKAIFIEFDPESNQIVISPEDTENGGGDESIPCDRMIGEKCRFKANYGCWQMCIRQINGLKVWIHFETENKMIHLTGSDDNQKYVVAPMIIRQR